MLNVLSDYSDDLPVVAKVEDQLPAEKANLAFHSLPDRRKNYRACLT